MMYFFIICYLFMIGSISGWFLELLFRRLFTAKKWINPGFLVGPYLPLYGFGLVLLFTLTYSLNLIPFESDTTNAIVIILLLGFSMTLIEYITGLIFIRGMNIRLWDYTNRWGNIGGIICPLFSFFWVLISTVYFFFVHRFVLSMTTYFEGNLYLLFPLGLFFGVFLVDNVYSFDLATKMMKIAKESKILIKYEHLKKSIAEDLHALSKKRSFLFPFKSPYELGEAIKSYRDKGVEKIKEKIHNIKK